MGWDLNSYEPVEERLAKFWVEHPHGRVVTDLIHHADGEYIFKATVFVSETHYLVETETPDASPRYAEKLPDATGWAHDSTANLPNTMKSSALEVCETSAIGRALANLGYAPKGQRPSREEMSKANYQGTPTKASEGPPSEVSLSGPAQTTPLSTRQAPSDSSDAEAHKGPGEAPSHSTASDGNGQEPGAFISPAGVAESPAPADPSAFLDAAGVKVLAAALGGQKAALDLARDNWPGTTSLRHLTAAQGAELLEIKGVPA